MEVIRWLQKQPEVDRVLYPALETDPGYALWKRDFHGANSLFSVAFKAPVTAADANRFVDALTMFGIGASWGGYESLVTVPDLKSARSVTDWSRHGPILRLHIGLEEPEDLLADLAQALESLSNPRLPVAD